MFSYSKQKTYEANFNAIDIVNTTLCEPIAGSTFRIYPVTCVRDMKPYSDMCVLKFELLGCGKFIISMQSVSLHEQFEKCTIDVDNMPLQ